MSTQRTVHMLLAVDLRRRQTHKSAMKDMTYSDNAPRAAKGLPCAC